jgi:hypothetical protein
MLHAENSSASEMCVETSYDAYAHPPVQQATPLSPSRMPTQLRIAGSNICRTDNQKLLDLPQLSKKKRRGPLPRPGGPGPK